MSLEDISSSRLGVAEVGANLSMIQAVVVVSRGLDRALLVVDSGMWLGIACWELKLWEAGLLGLSNSGV